MYKKWLIAIALCTIGAVTAVMSAAAAWHSNIKYITENGEAIITGSDAYSGIISYNIPKTLDGCPVTRISNSAFYNCTKGVKFTIPDTVASIGSFAYQGCTSMTTIHLPSQLTTIGSSVFKGCTSLKTIEAPITVKEKESDLKSGNRATVKYYCTVQYVRNGEVFKTDTVYEGEDAVLPEVSEGELITVSGKEWDGKNVTGNITAEIKIVPVIKPKTISMISNNLYAAYTISTADTVNGLHGEALIAVYDESRRLIGLYSKPIAADDGKDDVENIFILEDTPKYSKAMLIESFASPIPICVANESVIE